MAKKSKLLAALDAYKGRDYEAEKRAAKIKAAEKRKRQKAEKEKLEKGEDATDENDEKKNTTSAGADQQPQSEGGEGDEFESFSGGSDSEDEDDEKDNKDGIIPQPAQPADASASEAENESDVPLSDLEDEDLEDTIPHQRLTINNGPALVASRNRVAVVKSSKTPFHYHNSLVVSTLPPAEEAIPDPNDDLTRELEFYRIAREGAVAGRALLKKEGVPFSRPNDYFAEMVKSDEHMGKVKKKMYDDAAAKKAAEEARKLRDAKKFGKQVQVAKEQERAREKRNTLDKIKELKRKRKGQDTGKVTEDDNDLFQSIDVENGPAKDRAGRERGPGPNAKRQKRDQKYGFGGKKRFSKSGDAVSSADIRGFSAAKMKGKAKPKRPGKSRRASTK
ncbi:rRNA-processing protein EBP2 [Exophiala dermatitidis]|nr:rRNA-processing protein EBP2 [Exophiala dermatitidis]KAJ4512333.1 rRNA-processing protein EBP2 [Exophiala dermatitidis]KAJ4512789.1 rRNA-processing protein EBP2 [Exophiala dermatitidis]KAJ4546486.1 rRNA-processing protein EBP2 [Exophiala dermatitidis]KAJ4548288.1 rRNA-processing protein EBP2 [Exophiala dermatitidis]